MKSSMVAKHARWPKENDIIFNLSERAQLAEKTIARKKRNDCKWIYLYSLMRTISEYEIYELIKK